MRNFSYIRWSTTPVTTVVIRNKRYMIHAMVLHDVTMFYCPDLPDTSGGLIGVSSEEEQYYLDFSYIHLIFPKIDNRLRVTGPALKFHLMRMLAESGREIVAKEIGKDFT